MKTILHDPKLSAPAAGNLAELDRPPKAGYRPIAVNARFLGRPVTGVQRYAIEVCARLPAGLSKLAPRWTDRGPAGHFWEQVVLPARVRSSLLWSPCNTGPLAVSRQVVTIHDCSFGDCPDGFSFAFAAWYRRLVPRLARRVRRVITVSEFSRQRILETTGVAEDRVITIPNGVDDRFRPATAEAVRAVRNRLGLPDRYLLCVGSLEPRKNLVGLLEAWRGLGRWHGEVGLVLVGASSRVFRHVSLSGLPNLHLTGYLADEDLPPLYSGAEAFVYPSRYEGFGLPVLEAMACGAAVVCSNSAALPEVAGDAALLVDPSDVDAVVAGLERVLDDATLRERLRQLGPLQASRFDWDRTARRTWSVLLQAAEEG